MDREDLSTQGDNRKPRVRIERLASLDKVALSLLEEYYEAVHVVKRDSPEDVRKIVNEPGPGMWVAYLGDDAVGCVIVRKLEMIPSADCKRLYVRPVARGHGIAHRLMNALKLLQEIKE